MAWCLYAISGDMLRAASLTLISPSYSGFLYHRGCFCSQWLIPVPFRREQAGCPRSPSGRWWEQRHGRFSVYHKAVVNRIPQISLSVAGAGATKVVKHMVPSSTVKLRAHNISACIQGMNVVGCRISGLGPPAPLRAVPNVLLIVIRYPLQPFSPAGLDPTTPSLSSSLLDANK